MEAVEIEQPARVKIRGMKLDIMDEQMSKSQSKIQYASKYARVSNYWKYFIGQSEQLVKNKVFDKKQKIESSFTDWYQKSNLNSTYSQALPLIKNAIENSSRYTIPNVYFTEAIVGSRDNAFMIRNFNPRTPFSSLKDGKGLAEAKEKLLSNAEAYFKDYNAQIDENTLGTVLNLYVNILPKEFHPELLWLNTKYKVILKSFLPIYFESSYKSFELFKEFISDDKLSLKSFKKILFSN